MDTRGGGKRVNDVVSRRREGELEYNAASEHEKWCDEMTKEQRGEGQRRRGARGEDREEKRGGWGVYHAGAVGGWLQTERLGHLEATMCCSRNN